MVDTTVRFSMENKKQRFENIQIFLLITFIIFLSNISCSLNGEKSFAQISPNNQSNLKPRANSNKGYEKEANTNSETSENGLNDKRVGNGLIIPGNSIGLLNLRDNKEKAISYLGKPSDHEEYDRWGCPREEMVLWSFQNFGKVGIEAFLKDGIIYQIESYSERFTTEDGIKSGDDPKKLIKLYPNLQAYELLHSADEVDSKRNVIYWVDKKLGIAFVFISAGANKTKKISSIVIFDALSEFQPGGCTLPPQKLVKKAKWFLN